MISFKVNDKADQTRATKPIKSYYTFEKSIEKLIGGKPLEAHGVNTDSLLPECSNGFIEALNHSYNQHYALTLSPDDVWLTLSHSLAQHIEQNAETLRHHFVAHEGKKLIEYRNNFLIMGSPDNAWMDGFDYFSKEIKFYIGEKA